MFGLKLHYYIAILAFLGLVVGSGDKDGVFSEKELIAVEKLRSLLGDELYLDYMKSNEWLVRWLARLALSGNLPRLHRMIFSIFEKSAGIVRNIRKELKLSVHRVVIIVDLGGFNLRQHVCFGCLSLLSTLLETGQKHYPASFKNVYLVNAPRIARPIVELFLPTVSKLSRGAVKTYGYDKEEWRRELLKTIRPDQLTPQYGGTMAVSENA